MELFLCVEIFPRAVVPVRVIPPTSPRFLLRLTTTLMLDWIEAAGGAQIAAGAGAARPRTARARPWTLPLDHEQAFETVWRIRLTLLTRTT